VDINNSANNTIGGNVAGAANVIGFNGDNGVFVNASSGNAILSKLHLLK